MATDLHQAFTEQFASTQYRVYGYIVTLLPNRDDADEAFQETCIVLWNRWSQWDPSCEFVSWACGVAHNVVRNFRRSKKRRGEAIALSDELTDELAAVRLESDSLLQARSRALSACLEKLPADQRSLIESCYLGGEGVRAVAHRLALTPNTVSLRLYRIRQMLLDCIRRTLSREGER
jgi:RNA polymerase sigma-70 factor (ECF subfamily)